MRLLKWTFKCVIPDVLLPQDAGVEARILEVSWSEPDGVLLLAHAYAVERDGLLEVTVAQAGAAVPHEAEAHALRLAVVGPDVTIEQSALQPHRLTLQHPVLQVVHRPVCAAVHYRETERHASAHY